MKKKTLPIIVQIIFVLVGIGIAFLLLKWNFIRREPEPTPWQGVIYDPLTLTH